VAQGVLARAANAGWRNVAAYVPLRTEPGSLALLHGLRATGVSLLVPVVLADNDLDWTSWPDGTDRLGPEAIADVDAVLVPALAVTPAGVRLGRGGGSYDRALARLIRPVPRLALLYDGELVDELPTDPWDLPVSEVVTPSGWVVINPGRPGVDAE
jgi:5-formyltetrahydrofolate cyclo-ligase